MVAGERAPSETGGEGLHVVIADDDANVADVVTAILSDEGYAVSVLEETDHASIAAAVGRLEPDCILLDGAGESAFGGSWSEAAYLAARGRAVPTVMFTAHAEAVHEARDQASDRAAAAQFAAVVGKPFALDDLLDAVALATGRSERWDGSASADGQRTEELVEELRAAGALDIKTSTRREWATFRSPSDAAIYQLYWWQRLGRYVVGRYDEDARLQVIGEFFERSAAIEAATASFADEPSFGVDKP
jgi:DNA-binding response OmpR family regulator